MKSIISLIDEGFKKTVENIRDSINNKHSRKGKKPPASLVNVTRVINQNLNQTEMEKKVKEFLNLK